jgi:serine/threonine protein kinase
MNGGNLEFHLKRLNIFNENLAVFYSAQMISVLEFLHEKRFSNLYRYVSFNFLNLNNIF